MQMLLLLKLLLVLQLLLRVRKHVAGHTAGWKVIVLENSQAWMNVEVMSILEKERLRKGSLHGKNERFSPCLSPVVKGV